MSMDDLLLVSRLATIAAAVVATARDVGGAEKAEAGHR